MTALRSIEDVRDDLARARRELAALETGEMTWQEYNPDLRNGGLQDMAIEEAFIRLQELQQELVHAEQGEQER